MIERKTTDFFDSKVTLCTLHDAMASVEAVGNAKPTPEKGSSTDTSRPNNLQRIAQKKQLVKSYPRNKKLEKLAVYSSCKV